MALFDLRNPNPGVAGPIQLPINFISGTVKDVINANGGLSVGSATDQLAGASGLNVSGASTLTGNTAITGTLGVSGVSTLTGGFSAGANSSITGSLTVSTTLGVTGLSTLTGGFSAGANSSITGSLTVSTTLGVTGLSTLTGGFSAGANSSITGSLTISTTLGVTGLTTCTGGVFANALSAVFYDAGNISTRIFSVQNTNAGTAAGSRFSVLNNTGNGVDVVSLSSGFTTSGVFQANTGFFQGVGMTNGVFFGSADGSPVFLMNNATKVVQITTSTINLVAPTTQTTSPAAGGAGALPATPAGYVQIQIAGVNRLVAFY